MISTGKLLNAGHAPEKIVCLGPSRTWRDLRWMTRSVQSRLPVCPEKPLLLALDSTFLFVASLLACWQAKIPVIISPDVRPGTLEQLAPLIGTWIADRPLSISGVPGIKVNFEEKINSSKFEEPDHPKRWMEQSADELALELFTSGSGGARKRVGKTFAQLDNELQALQEKWGGICQDRTPCATVSHFHIYGLLFKVLWPLCRGDAFYERNFLFWEELLRELPPGPATILSSPAHLRYLPQAARQAPREWSQTRIFSSGGPLPGETARQVMAVCGHAPMEVYGSTETGGIASRQQSDSACVAWEPLPGVSFRLENGVLAVRSNRLPDAGEWFLTGDLATAEGASAFHLHGRNDRIVKVMEKRVSLDEMEARLCDHPAVGVAQALLLPMKPGLGRELIGMVIELTGSGKKTLAETGRVMFLAQLKSHLQRHFEAVTLPRRWRVVEKWPADAQGKIPAESLAELFITSPKPTRPIVRARERKDSGSLVHLRVPENLACLEGHFPRFKVIPGVCQLKWVVEEIEIFSGRPMIVSAMEAVKFHTLLVPGQDFSLEFGLKAGTGKWNYRLFHGDTKISSGRLQCAPSPVDFHHSCSPLANVTASGLAGV